MQGTETEEAERGGKCERVWGRSGRKGRRKRVKGDKMKRERGEMG